MKVHIATDHAGFELKEKVKQFLKDKGYEVEDSGAFTFDKNDDYPDYISKAAKKVSEDTQSRGIIFGSSGQGEAIVANKFANVRCVLYYGQAVPIKSADISGRESHDPYEMIRLTREHNNANMLSIGASFVSLEEACHIIKLWLDTPFPSEERHTRRINKILRLEKEMSNV